MRQKKIFACSKKFSKFALSFLREKANLAQLVEQLTCNQQVIGSSPIVGSKAEILLVFRLFFLANIRTCHPLNGK
jgi:hypothetical protein